MRTFSACCWLASTAWILATATSHAQPATLDAVPTLANASVSGDQFLAEVLATLQRRPSIAARLRHKARLHEIALTGSGKYWQRGVGKQRVTRWEMQTQVAGKTASYVQVFDGNHLWTDRTLPSGRKVHRLDVGQLQSRRRIAEVGTRSLGVKAEWEPLIAAAEGQGGLAEMLADALRRFTFAPRRTTQFNRLAVYALVGQWRRAELEKLWPELISDNDTPTWPRQLPHHVLLLVGQNNLFPYVVEHRRVDDAQLAATAAGNRPTRDPLLRYELYEVQFAAAMDDSLFEFKPGDVDWTDETKLVLERLRDQDAAAEATKAASRNRETANR